MADSLQHAPPDDREGVSGAVSAHVPLARADKGENRFLYPVSFNRHASDQCLQYWMAAKNIAKSPSARITIKIDFTTELVT